MLRIMLLGSIKKSWNKTYTNSRKIFESVVKASEILKEKLKLAKEELQVD